MRIGFYYPYLNEIIALKGQAGGGDIFVTKLMERINAHPGMEAVLIDMEHADSVDVVHVHSFGVPNANAVLEFKKRGKKVVLLPNWWHDNDLKEIRFRTDGQKVAEAVKGSFLLNWNSERRRKQAFARMKEALNAADFVVSFSNAEIHHMEHTFNTKINHCKKITIGVESFFYGADPGSFVSKYGIRDFALYVARIDDQKNHLNFMKAIRTLRKDIQIVIIGKAPDSKRYEMAFEQIKIIGGDRVVFIKDMPQQELASAYAAARLYVQPSLFEIPGMASLEAAVAGCRLAMTERGSTREIFENWSLYFNPLDYGDMNRKIELAWDTPPAQGQTEYFHKRFTWESTAAEAMEAYSLAMGR